MKMDRSEWYFPRDWWVLLGLHAIVPIGVIVAVCFLPAVSSARRGDPAIFWIAVILAVVGIVLLFFARLPLYRQGKFSTFGPKALPESHRRVYRIAYVFVGLGVVLLLALFTMF